MRLEKPRDLPTGTRHLQRHSVGGQQTLRQQSQPLGCARHPPRGADLPVVADRDHTEITVHIQADRTTHPSDQRHLFTSTAWWLTRWENQRKNDTDRYELERSIQASRRGGRKKSTGSKPIAKNGLPVCVLPMKAPVPDEPNVRSRPDGPFKHHFHAATSASLADPAVRTCFGVGADIRRRSCNQGCGTRRCEERLRS